MQIRCSDRGPWTPGGEEYELDGTWGESAQTTSFRFHDWKEGLLGMASSQTQRGPLFFSSFERFPEMPVIKRVSRMWETQGESDHFLETLESFEFEILEIVWVKRPLLKWPVCPFPTFSNCRSLKFIVFYVCFLSLWRSTSTKEPTSPLVLCQLLTPWLKSRRLSL